jgi:hypothetical protein
VAQTPVMYVQQACLNLSATRSKTSAKVKSESVVFHNINILVARCARTLKSITVLQPAEHGSEVGCGILGARAGPSAVITSEDPLLVFQSAI